MLPDLSNLDELAAQALEGTKWLEIWNKTYPKNMWMTPTPPRGAASFLQDPRAHLRGALEQQAVQFAKATPHPH